MSEDFIEKLIQNADPLIKAAVVNTMAAYCMGHPNGTDEADKEADTLKILEVILGKIDKGIKELRAATK